ncbi:MAG: acylphosphatase [Apilactobacillus sp.]|uniref:acylphosphatase n=1 Tax=Apilactobacillus TaxID=2767877 RepID=UPI0025E026F9|nr:acylphosphatase [Apilactobacillus sp.]MCT6822393.1 acylphosphatase [Apilactobacillus sp.]MCT6858625.1 acylphosphatase [Apilactobacillus sp.]
MNDKKSLEIIVSGKVQGVGFRFSTKKEADKLNLNGFVTNLSNGNVLINVSGTDSVVDKFINIIKQSPTPFGHVNNIEIKNIENLKTTGFMIK